MKDSPQDMSCDTLMALDELRIIGKEDERKLRLFSCALCRLVWPMITEGVCRHSVETAEAYADGLVSEEELKSARRNALKAKKTRRHPAEESANGAATEASFKGGWGAACNALLHVVNAGSRVSFPSKTQLVSSMSRDLWPTRDDGLRCTLGLFHCIFGNPLHAAPLKSSLLTPRVLDLARAVYEQRVMPQGTFDPQKLVALAGELRDAGCEDLAVLGHLQEAGAVHVRGCWVIDRLLQRQSHLAEADG